MTGRWLTACLRFYMISTTVAILGDTYCHSHGAVVLLLLACQIQLTKGSFSSSRDTKGGGGMTRITSLHSGYEKQISTCIKWCLALMYYVQQFLQSSTDFLTSGFTPTQPEVTFLLVLQEDSATLGVLQAFSRAVPSQQGPGCVTALSSVLPLDSWHRFRSSLYCTIT